MEDGTAKKVGEHDACYFCGDGPDSTEHVYGDCLVVRAARRDWGSMLGCNWADSMDSAMLTFRPVANKAYAIAVGSSASIGQSGAKDRSTYQR